nr:MAG TPA: RHO TERMINATION, TERMINATION, RNA BINDING.55A [Caudoviricetes sp.]
MILGVNDKRDFVFLKIEYEQFPDDIYVSFRVC